VVTEPVVVFAKVTELVDAEVTVNVPLYPLGENPSTVIFEPTGNGTEKGAIEPYEVTNPVVAFAKVTELDDPEVTVNVPLYPLGENPVTVIFDPLPNGIKDCVEKNIVTLEPVETTEVTVI
jgi:uncharacterized membrane protein required for colicin V production